MNNIFSGIPQKLASVLSLQTIAARHCVAMTAGISIAVALTAASFPAAAYQFESIDPAAVTPEAAAATIGCGKKAQSGLFTLTTTDGLGHTRSFWCRCPRTTALPKPIP